MVAIRSPKKLIEVALPLDDINTASTRENYIYKGNPSAIHKWWAQRPMAAARAIIFAQMVNDPGGDRGWYSGKSKDQAEKEREFLFDIIRDLVRWENNNNEALLDRAQKAINKSWIETCEINKGQPGFDPNITPDFLDPFAGGGTLPLEAKRLGLRVSATDLNPIPVMINRALLDIPSRFKGISSVFSSFGSCSQTDLIENETGLNGLVKDFKSYGELLVEKTREKIGKFYPDIDVTKEIVLKNPHLKNLEGQKLRIIAFMWARTVRSPSPAYNGVEVPLARSFMLSTKVGGEVYIDPKIEGKSYSFQVVNAAPENPEISRRGTKTARGANFECLLSGSPISSDYIKSESKAGRLGAKLLAIAVESPQGRTYVSPTNTMEILAKEANPSWRPDVPFSGTSQYLGVKPYGIDLISGIFTERQTLALETLTGLIDEIYELAFKDALKSQLPKDERSFEQGGIGAKAYAESICLYLAFAIDKYAIYGNSLVTWYSKENRPSMLFSQNALPMVWDFVEMNPFTSAGGGIIKSISIVADVIRELPTRGSVGQIEQRSATSVPVVSNPVISTDPPYYDNVPYSDLSDFFYVWMRKSLRRYFPKTFATISTPKDEELVAFSYRHKNQDAAELHFLDGMTQSMKNIADHAHSAYPITVYYAFKQSDTKNEDTASKGWETFLESVLAAGLSVTGTWPIRTERQGRTRSNQSNALASSIVLVCRKREKEQDIVSRRDFQKRLNVEMPSSIESMIGGHAGHTPIAPVDLAQAAIGPGMAIYSKYEAVLNQDGSRMSVHDALVLVNRAITDYLSPDSGSFDADTQFCSSWFEQWGWSSSQFGEADTLARAKGTSVDGVKASGVVESGGGKVRLLRWTEYESDWDPTRDDRTPVWEACHQMIRRLNNSGESAAGELLAKMPEKGEAIRQLAYHLYTLCERKKWAEEARAYNELIASWHAIVAASHDVGHKGEQTGLDF